MIVIASDLLADPVAAEPLTAPCLGHHNLVDVTTVTTTTATGDAPATNLGNPSTNLFWEAASVVPQYITVDTSAYTGEIDYLGIVGHNFGTEQTTVSLDVSVSGSWLETVAAFVPEDDSPLIFRFIPENLDGVRLHLVPLATASVPRAAAVYVGKLIVFERGVQAAFTPITYGRVVNVINGVSQNGNFLGNIITGARVESVASFVSLTAAWYRETLDPFLAEAMDKPFFFAWRPLDYPNEVGYVWLTENPQPDFDFDDFVAVDFTMTGVVA